MELHDRVRLVRKENDLSQSEFAERLGVTRSVISNVELDRLAAPEQKLPLIKLIAKEFLISEEWLLTGDGTKEASDEVDNLAKFLVEIKVGRKPFAAKYIDFLASLTDDEWEAFERCTAIMQKFYTEVDK